MQAIWRTSSRRAAYLLLIALALVNSGCLLIAAGVGAGGAAAGYAYFKGNVCRTYPASFADVWAAAQTSLTELGMPIETPRQRGNEGSLTTRTADGSRVFVEIGMQASRVPSEGQVTRVCVRVATFGDESFSQRLLDQIGYHLVPATRIGPPAPLPPPAAQQTAPPPLLPPEPVPATATSSRPR
jgi:hypothetical protein